MELNQQHEVRHLITRLHYNAVRVQKNMAEALGADHGSWLLQPLHGGEMKVATAVEYLTEFEECD